MYNQSRCLGLFLASVLTAVFSAQQETPPTRNERFHSCDEIVPLVEISPGETKELVLACSSSMMSRGRGLGLRKIKRTPEGIELEEVQSDEHGVSLSVPNMHAAAKAGDWDPKYSDLTAQSRYPFVLTITVAENAKPQVLELRVQNSSCSGLFATNVCVFVTTNEVKKQE